MTTRATLNIGLSSYEGSNYAPELESMLVTLRKAKALEWLANLGKDFYVEDRANPVLDAGNEPTMVVVVFDIRKDDISEASVRGLCDLIGQHCIAVLKESDFPTYQRDGYLCGRNPGPWMPFDFMRFIVPSRKIA
jgi:hypothetical protein